jgi:UDP-N-acetylglucosamine 2-epimerase (non-hydrolysing)
MQKLLIVLSTRPEIIRMALIVKKLKEIYKENLILVYTNQNFTSNLSTDFIKEFDYPNIDYYLMQKTQPKSLGEQLAMMIQQLEEVLVKEAPQKVIYLGDTNGCLCASIICARLGIKTYHLEAFNRCGNNFMAEEINRKLIDAVSSVNIPYTEKSRQNAKYSENYNKILVSGNPIYEVIKFYENRIENSDILNKLNLKVKDYFISTFHRSESVDDPLKLKEIIEGLNKIANCFDKKIICSIHPRTKFRLDSLIVNVDYKLNDNLIFVEAMGFFDFVKLEKNCLMSLSDSGTVPEESTIFKIPSVILRNETERPEIVESGFGIVSGIDSERILKCTKIMYNRDYINYKVPEGYMNLNVSDRVINFINSN